MAGPPPPPPGPEAPRYQEWILDTIDSLRSRKARPDLERICRMVRRRHGPEPERTRAELEKLIQQRAVLRVSYKGSISYRNAARVQPPRRPPPPPPPPPPARRAEPPVSLRDAARYLGGDGRLTRGRLQGSALPADGGLGVTGGPCGGGGGGSGPGPAPGTGGGSGGSGGGRLERTRLATIAMARAERGRGAAGRARKPPCSGTEASVREEDEEDEDEDEDGTGSEASEDGGAPRQLNGEAQGLLAGGERLPPPGPPQKRGGLRAARQSSVPSPGGRGALGAAVPGPAGTPGRRRGPFQLHSWEEGEGGRPRGVVRAGRGGLFHRGRVPRAGHRLPGAGDRREVAAADAAGGRADGALDPPRPRAQDLRVPRQAAAAQPLPGRGAPPGALPRLRVPPKSTRGTPQITRGGPHPGIREGSPPPPYPPLPTPSLGYPRNPQPLRTETLGGWLGVRAGGAPLFWGSRLSL